MFIIFIFMKIKSINIKPLINYSTYVYKMINTGISLKVRYILKTTELLFGFQSISGWFKNYSSSGEQLFAMNTRWRWWQKCTSHSRKVTIIPITLHSHPISLFIFHQSSWFCDTISFSLAIVFQLHLQSCFYFCCTVSIATLFFIWIQQVFRYVVCTLNALWPFNTSSSYKKYEYYSTL